MGKFWTLSKIGLTPPLSDILDFFEFQTYLKNADPPYRINFRLFWISDVVLYSPSSPIWSKYLKFRLFWKMPPPPSVFKSLNLNFRLICLFFYPPPLFWTKSEIFPFFNYEASPKYFVHQIQMYCAQKKNFSKRLFFPLLIKGL